MRRTFTTSIPALLIVTLSLFSAPARAAVDCSGVFEGEAQSEAGPARPSWRQIIDERVSFRHRKPEFPSFRFEEVNPGRVFRGPIPWNAEAMQFLVSKGVKKIYSLIVNEYDIATERELAARFGVEIEFLRVPNFLSTPNKAEVLRVVADLGRAARGEIPPVFLHCRRGKDRTGLFMGLHEVLNLGRDPVRVYDHMIEMGFAPVLRPLLMIWIEQTGYDPYRDHPYLYWWSSPRELLE